jgi:putative addiction module component (TIGR02574 family)
MRASKLPRTLADMSILKPNQIASLTFQEKIDLIDEVWASLDCTEVEASLDNAYNRLLEQRLADSDAELDQLITLDRASRQLREVLSRASSYAVSVSGAA